MDHPIYPSLPVLQTGSSDSDPYFIDPDFEEFANGGILFPDVLSADDLSSPSFVEPDDEAVTPPAVDSGGFFNSLVGLDQLCSDYDVAAADLSGSSSYLSKNLGSSWPPAASILWQQHQQQSTGTGQDLNILKNSPFNPVIPSPFEFPLSTTDSSYYYHQDHQVDEAAPDPLAQFGSLSPPSGGDSMVKRYDQLHDLSIGSNLGPKVQIHRRIQNPFENAHPHPRYRDAESHRQQQPNIARRSHRNLAQSLDPNLLLQRKPAQDGLILEAEFAAAVGTPYDPLWIEHYGLDPSQITFSSSAMKFDKLFLEKVIKVGDKLVLIPEHTPDAESITPPLRNVATVLSITRWPQHFPNLLINSCSSSPNEGLLIPRCAGTKQLALALIKEDSRLSAITPSRAWKHFRLYRANVNLGTLWDVRLRYNLWIDQVDAWAVRNGQQRRQRRSPRGTNVVFQDGLFQKLLPGGGLAVCEDQHEFDAPRRQGVRRRKSVA